MDTTTAQTRTARFIEIEGNPIPPNAKAGYVETPDGLLLRYGMWAAETRPHKGTIILLQGRAEHIEKYFETVQDLRQRGFGVVTFDWRGQGGSQRLISDPSKGHVEQFDQYLTDLDTIISEIALPEARGPFYIMAHSMGGLIALLGAPQLSNRIRRMILLSPLLNLRGLPFSQAWLERICGVMSFLGFGRTTISWGGRSVEDREFEGNNLTSDRRRFARNGMLLARQGDEAVSSPTVNWIFAACRAMDRVNAPGYAGTITIPTLLIAAGNDPIVSPSAVEHFGSRMRSGTFHTIFGAKHELLQERDIYRDQVFAALEAFIPGSDDDLHPERIAELRRRKTA